MGILHNLARLTPISRHENGQNSRRKSSFSHAYGEGILELRRKQFSPPCRQKLDHQGGGVALHPRLGFATPDLSAAPALGLVPLVETSRKRRLCWLAFLNR
jgi:hypothetical protein